MLATGNGAGWSVDTPLASLVPTKMIMVLAISHCKDHNADGLLFSCELQTGLGEF